MATVPRLFVLRRTRRSNGLGRRLPNTAPASHDVAPQGLWQSAPDGALYLLLFRRPSLELVCLASYTAQVPELPLQPAAPLWNKSAAVAERCPLTMMTCYPQRSWSYKSVKPQLWTWDMSDDEGGARPTHRGDLGVALGRAPNMDQPNRCEAYARPGTLQMWAQWLAQMPDIDIQDRVLSVTAQLPGPKGNANAQGTCATTGTKYGRASLWNAHRHYRLYLVSCSASLVPPIPVHAAAACSPLSTAAGIPWAKHTTTNRKQRGLFLV
ncbi:hypothetical protein PCL_03210 [Purpureocillium lilacinum]|uniref:Uncharacterized protein n=1 Tax=Purpureocillium lilacinum TaxID=33203 RepID=A0A2U3DYX0_PURLI|nr:hypothetical protein Purlil1_653 [Purpureocillium lilacinum]PWI67442.1 hypothetical protein PCL_03210 [Purpureocillium lilacinum]